MTSSEADAVALIFDVFLAKCCWKDTTLDDSIRGLTGNNPVVLGTLAAAHAEAGNYPEAMLTVRRAIELARAQHNEALARLLQSHLRQYQAGKPVISN